MNQDLANRMAAAIEVEAKRQGLAASVDIIALIMSIIQTIMSGCTTPPATLKEAIASRDFFVTYNTIRAVRSTLNMEYGVGGYIAHDGSKITNTILAVGAQGTEDDLASLMSS